MKLLKLTVEGLPHFNGIFDIDFIARQRVSENDKKQLYNVFSKIYINQVIAFVGINASGKTTILKVLSFVMNMLKNESINNSQSKEVLNDLENNQKVTITSYFYNNGFVNKLQTVIAKEINIVDNSEKFIIVDESLWSKESSRIKTKKSIFEFKSADLKQKRNQDEQYLMNDISIIIAINKKNNKSFFVSDMLEWTDHNMINILGQFPKELLMFLDPSIEYLQ